MRALLTITTFVVIAVGTALGTITSRLVMPSPEPLFESGATLSRLDAPIDLYCKGNGCRLCFEAHHAAALQATLCASDEQRVVGALAGSATTALGLIALWILSRRHRRRGQASVQ